MKTNPTAQESGWRVSFWFAVSSPLIGALLAFWPRRFFVDDRGNHEHGLSNLDLQCSCRRRLLRFGLFFGSSGARRLWFRHIWSVPNSGVTGRAKIPRMRNRGLLIAERVLRLRMQANCSIQ